MGGRVNTPSSHGYVAVYIFIFSGSKLVKTQFQHHLTIKHHFNTIGPVLLTGHCTNTYHSEQFYSDIISTQFDTITLF